MVWAGISYGQHNCIFSMAIWMHRYRDEIMRSIVVPFIRRHHLMFQHDNARPQVARICTQFLEAKNVAVIPWPAYSPDMSLTEHVWDALDWRLRQHVPVPTSIQQIHTAIDEECYTIPQATINSLINSLWRWCVVLHEENGGYTRYRLVFGSMPLPFCCCWHLWPIDEYNIISGKNRNVHFSGPCL